MSLYEGNVTIKLEDYNSLIRQAHNAEILQEVIWNSVSGRYGLTEDKHLMFDNAPIEAIMKLLDYEQYMYISNAFAEKEAKKEKSDTGEPMN